MLNDVDNYKKFLDEVYATLQNRHEEYGECRGILENLSKRWSQILKCKVTREQVAMCLLDLKIVRLIEDNHNRDSIIDIAGYASLLHAVLPSQGAKI